MSVAYDCWRLRGELILPSTGFSKSRTIVSYLQSSCNMREVLLCFYIIVFQLRLQMLLSFQENFYANGHVDLFSYGKSIHCAQIKLPMVWKLQSFASNHDLGETVLTDNCSVGGKKTRHANFQDYDLNLEEV